MKIWVDAQLSPALAPWIKSQFAVDALALRDLGLRGAEDREIFQRARSIGTVVMSKDVDFAELVLKLGSPPQILWITCGNTANAEMKSLLLSGLPQALDLLSGGEPLVELGRR